MPSGSGRPVLVLAVPLEVRRAAGPGRRSVRTTSSDLFTMSSVQVIGVGLGARVERDAGHRVLAGRREHVGSALELAKKPPKRGAHADAVLETERVVGDAVVDRRSRGAKR